MALVAVRTIEGGCSAQRAVRVGRCCAGIVLAEAIAGTVVLAIALVVVLGLVGRSVRAQSAGENLQIAAMLIDEKLGEVVMLGPERFQSQGQREGVCAAPYQRFRFSVTLRGGRAGDPYDVTATVSWAARGGERSETVRTFVAPREGDDPDPDRRPDRTVEREP